ncbi:MAG: hypothetical protein ABR957_16290 [Terracidiphilus sp.]|jgi:hypothetical protein
MSDTPDTISWEELRKPFHLRQRKYRGGKTPAEVFAEREALAPPLRVPIKISKPAELRTAKRTELPATSLPVKSKPLSECDDNPVLNEQGAAFIVGVSADLLKKWRQRKRGPDYIQYGPGGPVRYELKALMAFRDDYKVYLHSKSGPRREAPAGA